MPEELHRQLHAALLAWKPAGDRSIAAVSTVAEQIPGLAGPAKRIRKDGGRLTDWWAIADTDPLHDWPDLRALARNPTNLLELSVSGLAVRHGGNPGIAWEVEDGRATWSERCLVLGHQPSGQEPRFIDGVNQGMNTLPYPWYPEAHPVQYGRVALIADRFGFSNYFHWMVGGLRRLLAMDRGGLLDKVDETLVFVRSVPDFVPESIEAVGLGKRPITLVPDPFDLRAASMVFGTSDQLLATLPTKRYGPLLRERIDARAGSSTERRRILVSRRDAAVRRVVNEDRLMKALEPLGFEMVIPGELSFREQANTFGEAEIVVAPHGAALTNLLFCSPHTTVIELQDLACSRPWFKNLSESNRLRYHAVACPAPKRSPEDLRVDVERVLALAGD